MAEYGWRYEVSTPQGARQKIYPAASGSLSYDGGRDVSKTLSSLVFLPDEISKMDLVADEIVLTFVLDGVEHNMGFYSTVEATRQKDVLLNPTTNEVSDLWTTGFGDRLARLIRSDGKPITLQAGFDPAQEAIQILSTLEIPFGWEGSTSPAGDSISWDGQTTVLAKISQLSELAGHRHPWMNNDGVIRSVVARTPSSLDPSIIEVSDLQVEANSLTVTETYLSAPNVVIVTGNSPTDVPVTGRWDAPSVSPHSYAQRGYFYTVMVSRQGLRDNAHAASVAKAIGESYAARTLNFRCQPTHVLDGPVTLRYDDTLWVVESWSIDLGPAGTMDVQASELTGDPLDRPTSDLENAGILSGEVFTVETLGLDWAADSGTSILVGNISAGSTSFQVSTPLGDPLWTTSGVSFPILIDSEVMTVTNVTGTSSPQTFTVTRGGSPVPHLGGAKVTLGVMLVFG